MEIKNPIKSGVGGSIRKVGDTMLKVLRQYKHKRQNNTHKHTIKITTQQTHENWRKDKVNKIYYYNN